MDKLEIAIRTILNCDLCNGVGTHYWSSGEDYYDFESCECNPYELILDGEDVVWDNGLLSEGQLFTTAEAL